MAYKNENDDLYKGKEEKEEGNAEKAGVLLLSKVLVSLIRMPLKVNDDDLPLRTHTVHFDILNYSTAIRHKERPSSFILHYKNKILCGTEERREKENPFEKILQNRINFLRSPKRAFGDHERN